MEFLTNTKCACKLCNHTWFSKKNLKPKRCPKCFNFKWDILRKNRACSFGYIPVGEGRVYKWYVNADGSQNNMLNLKQWRSFNSFAKRNKDMSFRVSPEPRGLVVYRIE